MGLIKEPIGVDFIIQSKPLTDKDRIEISEFIKSRKEQNNNLVPNKSTKKTKIKA